MSISSIPELTWIMLNPTTMTPDRILRLSALVLLLATSIIQGLYFQETIQIYYIVTPLAGVIAAFVPHDLHFRRIACWIIGISMVITVAFVTSHEGMGLPKLLTQLALLPGGNIALFYLGWWFGGLLRRKYPVWFHAAFVLYVFICFLFLLTFIQDLTYSIGFWAVFSSVYSYHMFQRGSRVREVLIAFSLLPLISTVLFLIGGNIFFWDISVPSMGAMLIGIAGGWALHRRRSVATALTVGLGVLALGVGAMTWWSMNAHVNVDTHHHTVALPDVPLVYESDTMTLRDLKGKVLVLDFWHTHCGPCYAGFPKFEALKRRFAGHDGVRFFAVNHPIKTRNPVDPREKMASLGYSFDNLYLPSDTLAAALGVQAYPTLMIISKDQTRHLTTRLELSPAVLNNTPALIEDMLRE